MMKTLLRIWVVLLWLTGVVLVKAQGLTFTTNTFVVGGEPTCVAASDINGDGLLDLVAVSYNPSGSGTMTVLTNSGGGQFGFNTVFNAGSFPAYIAAVDINGSGKVDIITASGGLDDTLTLWTNSAGGLLGSNLTLTVVGGPRSAIAEDLNGDGRLDLITANLGSSSLTVFTNNGNGAFGSNATLMVPNEPISVAAADVNGDGKSDLICADTSAGRFALGQLVIFTNSGNGVLSSNATLVVGAHPVFVAAADLNGDGNVDLISVNNGDSTLTVLTNNGSGVFGSNATLNVGASPVCVAVADLNGDGKPDLITVDSGANSLMILTNNGNGEFSYNTTLLVGNGPTFVIAVDVNGDGKPDLICANGTNTLTMLLNSSPFPPPGVVPPLTINPQGNVVRIAWPSSSPGWSLEQNPDLQQISWLPSGYDGYSIFDNGTNKSLTLPLGRPNLFFRLLHP